MVTPQTIKSFAIPLRAENRRFCKYIQSQQIIDQLDDQIHKLHKELFANYDCCLCGNCCKEYEIELTNEEAELISQITGKPIDDFAKRDLFGYIFKNKPCIFLEASGKCQIYDNRPNSCRGFPFTDKPERLLSFHRLVAFAEDCPVVFEMIQRLKEMYNWKS